MNIHYSDNAQIKKIYGFTLTESMISLAILLLLFSLAAPTYQRYQNKSNLQSQTEEIMGHLALARNKTISAEGDSNWGVRITTSTNFPEIILFKGESYDTRDTSSDIKKNIHPMVRVATSSFNNEDWVVFKRVTGQASSTGYVALELTNDPSQTKTIYLNQEGLVSVDPIVSYTGSVRITDSRHIHIDYDPFTSIDTNTDDIIIYFDGVPTTIPIIDNMINGQIVWSDQIDVSGSIQEIGIRTHVLNNPNTIFSIHREVHLNNKSMEMYLSSDADTLITYSADGKTVSTGTSIYVDLVSWQ